MALATYSNCFNFTQLTQREGWKRAKEKISLFPSEKTLIKIFLPLRNVVHKKYEKEFITAFQEIFQSYQLYQKYLEYCHYFFEETLFDTWAITIIFLMFTWWLGLQRLVIELWFVIFQNCSKPNTLLTRETTSWQNFNENFVVPNLNFYCGNSIAFLLLRFLREINFEESRSAKSALLAHLEALNFNLYEFLHFLKAKIYHIKRKNPEP